MKKKRKIQNKTKFSYIQKWIIAFVFTVALGFGSAMGIIYYYSQEIPPLSELKHYDLKTASEVFDRYDNLIHTFAVEKRKLTNLSELPIYVRNGMLAIEDKTFYSHWGMDLFGFIRAMITNVKRGSFAQGASTITQQLSRNMFLTLDKKIARKIKEIIVSVKIERLYSKDEILEMYFNKVLFGPGLYGIEAASNKYFGKDAKDLTIAEAALICGMPQRPSYLNPIRHPERAYRRRNIVLQRMYEENVITKFQYLEAKATPIEIYEATKEYTADDYFLEHVRQTLEKKYGTNRLFGGGLKIYTTVDMDLTTYADSMLNKSLSEFENKNNYEFKYADFPADTIDIETPYVQGGVYTIEPETGYVRVMIGGRNFSHSKFNRMKHARRQPGSAFKPILYTTALENGYTPATVIQDEIVTFTESDTIFWSAHNYSRKYYGYTRMRDALKHSRNIYAVKMMYDLGPKKVVKAARRFGLTTRIPAVYSLAIGTCEVKPIELISSYTTFPNNGDRVEPIYIRRIENDQGQIIEKTRTKHVKVTDPEVAYLMADMMTSVIDEGTGRGVRWQNGGYRWNAAGKTGTTDDYRDTWFIGYNNELVTGIWVGFDNNDTLGKGKTGANTALPAWPPIMKYAVEKDSYKDKNGRPVVEASRLEFDKPEGIVSVPISKKSGLLPKNSFSETLLEHFVEGTQPTPLSDSLAYNFYPTFYRINNADSLIINFGGKPTKYQPTQVEVDYRNAKIYFHKLKKYFDDEMMKKEYEEYIKEDTIKDSLEVMNQS